jgi:hypothetical protein
MDSALAHTPTFRVAQTQAPEAPVADPAPRTHRAFLRIEADLPVQSAAQSQPPDVGDQDAASTSDGNPPDTPDAEIRGRIDEGPRGVPAPPPYPPAPPDDRD